MPPNVHPAYLRVEEGRLPNINQMKPYTSADIRRQSELYHNLRVVFDDVFDWMVGKVRNNVSATASRLTNQVAKSIFPRYIPRYRNRGQLYAGQPACTDLPLPWLCFEP